MNHLNRVALLMGGTLSLACAHAASNPNNAGVAPTVYAGLQANTAQVHATSTAQPLASITYSGTTVGGPTFVRPNQDCRSQSGEEVAYHAQSFVVSEAGAYAISSSQDFDGFIFVYEGVLDPASPTDSCMVGNDDWFEVGQSRIDPVELSAGRVYTVVTTAWSSDDAGTFTNTLSGPGTISFDTTDLVAIDKSLPTNVAIRGEFTYLLTAQATTSASAAGVVVTDVLPSGLSFVDSTCGASASGGTVTWNVGTLAGESSASCTISVYNPASICSLITNTATISTTDPEANIWNNTSSVENRGGNIVADPSFEDGLPSSHWVASSTSNESPVCSVEECGGAFGNAARTGDHWVWFGRSSSDQDEITSVEQNVFISSDATDITFWALSLFCADNADFVRLTIDGTEVWRRDNDGEGCGGPEAQPGRKDDAIRGAAIPYEQQSVSLGAFADNAQHVIRFEANIAAGGGKSGNVIFLDDVAIEGPPVCSEPTGEPQPSEQVQLPVNNVFSLLLMILGLGGIAWYRARRSV